VFVCWSSIHFCHWLRWAIVRIVSALCT